MSTGILACSGQTLEVLDQWRKQAMSCAPHPAQAADHPATTSPQGWVFAHRPTLPRRPQFSKSAYTRQLPPATPLNSQ